VQKITAFGSTHLATHNPTAGSALIFSSTRFLSPAFTGGRRCDRALPGKEWPARAIPFGAAIALQWALKALCLL
jgi:hypothetical protein